MDAKAPFFSNIRHELWKLVEQLQIIEEEKIEKIEKWYELCFDIYYKTTYESAFKSAF